MNMEFIETEYRRWKKDPESISRDWRLFFQGFDLGYAPAAETGGICEKAQVLRQARVDGLIHRYRELGHLLSCVDPLAPCAWEHPLLSLEAFGLEESDLRRTFFTPGMDLGEQASLQDIVRMLKETYCGSVGVEYMHIQDPEERDWLRQQMEPVRNHPRWPGPLKIQLLEKLLAATRFENFLHRIYLGQKRFSLEGAETVVVVLNAVIHRAAQSGCRQLVLGMAHRGRLNVQVNVLGKRPEQIFCEFEDNYDPDSIVGSGDVKYHRGYGGELEVAGGRRLQVLLVPNPSHLESVDPVVEGIARARQQAGDERDPVAVLPVLVHGDSAFAGQGVVFETLNLSQLEGYRTGGTVHLVINNQIGFTTVAAHARSTRYATDVAKMLLAPIFHVHGEDVEAALHVARLACDYRYRYGKDVVIDIICYRRHGHNEGDEPYYTQPQMYQRIRGRPPVSDLYATHLVSEGVISADQVAAMRDGIDSRLKEALQAARRETCLFVSGTDGDEPGGDGVVEGSAAGEPETAVAEGTIRLIADQAHRLPPSFKIAPKLGKILAQRRQRLQAGEGIDWASAELLAFGSLLLQGIPVRLSGQDCGRGTFSQRHSVLTDTDSERVYRPLNHLAPGQARFQVFDSSLSEYGVLGFEYGYSLADPRVLVLWEAQFGDFANNAQVVIDQYLAGAHAKWNRASRLVLLLPHGYEGLGPEHSSARPERYLQLCAEDNLRVCWPSTPAQYFHLLRRQALDALRRPLVMLTPKSLLRHREAVSSRGDFCSGTFRRVIDDPDAKPAARRGILCAGKIYYELAARRRQAGGDDTAILRLEQIYPFPGQELEATLNRYPTVARWLWVQEEPRNMGAWSFVCPRLEGILGRKPAYVGRPEAAVPATGLHSVHRRQQEELLNRALGQGE